MSTVKLVVKLSERGLRVGESHGRAKLTDRDVELMRQLHEEGMSCYALAKKFGCSHGYAKKVARRFTRRATTATRVKIVTLATTG
jgi:Mor family transcriptional regulator